MGLDMYLRKNNYIRCWKSKDSIKDAEEVVITIEQNYGKDDVDIEKIVVTKPEFGIEINTPIAYWRKANAIHRWFVDLNDGVDDCKPITVYGDKILELVDLCKQVLADHSKAQELLPSQEGFFFGSTDYDEWYYQDLQKTVDMLKDIDPNCSYIYEASW